MTDPQDRTIVEAGIRVWMDLMEAGSSIKLELKFADYLIIRGQAKVFKEEYYNQYKVECLKWPVLDKWFLCRQPKQ